jgi:hypothetical protein
MISNKNIFFSPNFWWPNKFPLLFSLMKKVNKKIKMPEGIAAVAASLQKTSPISAAPKRETPPCFLYAMLPGIESPALDFSKLEDKRINLAK